MTFGQKVIDFYRHLAFEGQLPKGIQLLKPYSNNQQVLSIAKQFYQKYYRDSNQRTLILGINPGRLGAGSTGIPFTDTKRLLEVCGIAVGSIQTHEPSSVFIYEMIEAFGGAELFYKKFYISSVCPLGFVSVKDGKEVNYNYYDSAALQKSVDAFCLETIQRQIDFGINRKVCFCLGTGKNFSFLSKMNATHQLFEQIIPLEHPRYVMQYKSKTKSDYITKYLEIFSML